MVTFKLDNAKMLTLPASHCNCLIMGVVDMFGLFIFGSFEYFLTGLVWVEIGCPVHVVLPNLPIN